MSEELKDLAISLMATYRNLNPTWLDHNWNTSKNKDQGEWEILAKMVLNKYVKKEQRPQELELLSEDCIIELFGRFQLHEHFEQTTKTGIPDWNYADLAKAICAKFGAKPMVSTQRLDENKLRDFIWDKDFYTWKSLSMEQCKRLSKAICDRFSPSVVLPERNIDVPSKEVEEDSPEYNRAIGWNACLDATIELNKQAKALPSEWFNDVFDKAVEDKAVWHNGEVDIVLLKNKLAKAVMKLLKEGR